MPKSKQQEVPNPYADFGIVGGRETTPEQMMAWQRQQSGVAPEGASNPPTAPAAPGLDVRTARHALAKRIAYLTRQAEGLERPVNAIGASGVVVPHLQQLQADNQAQLEVVRGELERLSSLDDAGVVDWAVNSGAVRRLYSGGFLVS